MGIFISYRRSDSAPWAGRIYDSLVDTWGEDDVYMDVDTIAPGDDFRTAIATTLARSDVVLVIIGPEWLTVTDEHGKRRLDDRADVHRNEVVSALNREVRIIPVLVGGATMPEPSDLPAPMRQLAFRNAVEIDDRHFRSHLESLEESLARFAEELTEARAARPAPPETPLSEPESPTPHPSPRHTPGRHSWPASVLVLSVAIGAVVGLLAVVALLAIRDDDDGSGGAEPTTAPAVVAGDSFVVFETDRGDPAADPAVRRHSVWRVNADGSDARSLIASSGSDGHPTLSSDGGRVAYLHTDTPDDVESWQLVVSQVDGSNARVLVEGVRRTYRPAWSPDDMAIVIPLSEDGQVDLWRIDLANGERQQLTDTPEPEYDPDWSSTGLVFRRDVDEDNAEIFTSDADGSNARRITEHPGYDSDPRWSTDGSLILFTRNFGPGNHEVCVMGSDGSSVVNLTNAPGNDQDAMWLSTDESIVFVSDRDGGSQIYTMRSDGSDQQRLMESTSRDGTPDGR
jgi:Tol biopolymer transport system component